jgi:MFS family permease
MFLSAYRPLLRRPGAVPVSSSAGLAFAGLAGEPLAMLLVARDGTGSFATAGLVLGAYGLSAGLLAPARGRALDRRGMRALVPIAALHLAALTALLIAAQASGPAPALIALAALGGTARSPIFGALRTLWGELVPPDQLAQAYAFQAVLQQVSYLIGPLLVGAILTIAAATVALACVTVLTFLAVAGFARTRVARTWQPAPGDDDAHGPIRSRGLRVLATTAGLTNATVGMVTVALPAFAAREDATPLGGVLVAALTAGSLLGGLAYGAHRWSGPVARRYALLLAAFCAGVAVLAAAGSITPMLPATLLAGTPLAALMSCRFQLIDTVASRSAANEAALWLSSAEAAGVAFGQALAGRLVDDAGIAITLLAAAGPAALAALFTATSASALSGQHPQRNPGAGHPSGPG